MKDTRTEFQRFTDFMKAIVKVPKADVAAQKGSTRPPKAKQATPKA
jgi:hypothetical protein